MMHLDKHRLSGGHTRRLITPADGPMTNGTSDAAGAPRPPVAEDGLQRIPSLLSKTAM